MSDFTKILLKAKLVSQDQLLEADKMAKRNNQNIGEVLVKLGYVTSELVTKARAKANNMRYVDLNEVSVPPSVIEIMPESMARENVVLPIDEEDGKLRIVTADPDALDTFEKLRFILNRRIDVALAPREAILEAINKYYGGADGESADSMLQEFTDTAIDFTESDDDKLTDETEADANSAPIVKFVSLMIQEAVQLRASDIHVEPFENKIRIRYRIDGRLVIRDSPPKRLLGALLSRIKILAKMDIAERRRPQDGRIKVSVGAKELDLRVSMLPSNHGQSAVMRLLDKDNIKVGVKQLGLGEDDYRNFRQLIRRPNGIILVTGPTGSGKTTTLYAGLNEMNRPDRKIITAEDPVEYYLPGINQVEVRHDIGLDFARIIRSMLRQAPNIILVGEMRDAETAQMGIQASLTGHLVFSTLHTNDAPSAITRMVDIGVPNYLVASSLIAVLAQRLVRLICSKCKEPFQPKESMLEEGGITPEMAAGATFMHGRGCKHCQNSGYRGRQGIFELMIVTSKIRELIFQSVGTQDLRKAAIAQGMSTLYNDGIRKVLKGVTTLEEVYRVAKKTEQDNF
jgi:type IV pilus assembly protein PilB